MRMVLLVLALLLAVPAAPALAQTLPGTATESDTLESVRRETRSVLLTARDWALHAFDKTKEWTGLTNDQLLGAGVGAATGLVVADLIGFGGLVSAVAAVGGAYVGKWVVDADGVGVR